MTQRRRDAEESAENARLFFSASLCLCVKLTIMPAGRRRALRDYTAAARRAGAYCDAYESYRRELR